MKDLVFLTVSSFIEKFASFILYSLLAYNFGKESLGYFSYYFVLANIFFLLFDFGGTTYGVKYFTGESYEDNVFDVILLKTFIYAVCAPFIFFFINDTFFIIFYISFFLESLLSVIKSGILCRKQFLTFSYYMMVEKIMLIIIAIAGTFAIKNLLIFYLALLISKTIVLFIVFLRRPGIRFFPSISTLSMQKIKSFANDSWSYTFYSFFALVYGRVGIIIMKNFSENSLGDVGIFSSYENIIMATLIIPEIFFKRYYPAVTEDYIKKDTHSMYEKIKSVLKISLVSSFFIALFVAMFSKEIAGILFGPEFVETKILLTIFSVKIAFRFALRPYLAVVASSDFTGFRFYISFIIFFISIGVNFALIPFFGINGLVGAAIIVEIVLFLSYRVFCERKIIKRSFLAQDLFLFFQITVIGTIAIFLNNSGLIFRIIIFVPVILLTLGMFIKEKNNFIFRRDQ